MGLAYLICKECAFQIALKNATANLNKILSKMSTESAKEFVRVYKKPCHKWEDHAYRRRA